MATRSHEKVWLVLAWMFLAPMGAAGVFVTFCGN